MEIWIECLAAGPGCTRIWLPGHPRQDSLPPRWFSTIPDGPDMRLSITDEDARTHLTDF
ncbi:MAG TPA: hypothetical protein VGF67_21180 [Ktedonobacteraceae bacterium]|jgi:hypothetical protein